MPCTSGCNTPRRTPRPVCRTPSWDTQPKSQKTRKCQTRKLRSVLEDVLYARQAEGLFQSKGAKEMRQLNATRAWGLGPAPAKVLKDVMGTRRWLHQYGSCTVFGHVRDQPCSQIKGTMCAVCTHPHTHLFVGPWGEPGGWETGAEPLHCLPDSKNQASLD